MTILDAGDITPKQASALFDVTLGEFPFFAECAQAVAYNHSGIISPVRLEGKQRTCGCEVRRAVGHLCNLLFTALNERAREKFKAFTRHYIVERNKFFGQPSPDDRKYPKLPAMEGIARYVHIRSAEAAEHYQPSPEYAAPPDYLSFETYAREARSDTLSELKKADLATWKRTLVYSFGASEGLLLDRLRPNGALDPYFESSLREYAKINPGGNGQVLAWVIHRDSSAAWPQRIDTWKHRGLLSRAQRDRI